jgi:hypothetical protein
VKHPLNIPTNVVKGQKVRLSALGLRFHKASANYIDWIRRTGTIGRMSVDGKRAQVLWDGNRTLSDPLPVSFFEAVEYGADGH